MPIDWWSALFSQVTIKMQIFDVIEKLNKLSSVDQTRGLLKNYIWYLFLPLIRFISSLKHTNLVLNLLFGFRNSNLISIL